MQKQILILEDDKINQELIKFYLNNQYKIKIVSSVTEAIHEVSSSNYDLVISDLILGADPKTNGLTFLKQLKSDSKYKHIPVVSYSAHTDPDLIKDFDANISKPISKIDFMKRIESILEKN